ncbi:unnamed protein product [Orchesella dallaii]|uniref:Transcription initiation factor TFIID subunit 8 n=1 Tax=Orchesella dallaii TaxID=48710 RepID=A0ABP1R8V3_9HEXA
MVEPPMNTSRRKMIQHVVSLFAQEGGFHVVEKPVLETLTEMFQATLFEFGRSTRMFTELAGRVEPTVGDVTMALIDMGFKVDPRGLRAYSKRMTRPMISAPQTLPLPKVPTILSAGKKRALPPYIPDYFPPMPDPHAYIRTPTHKQPITDYAACREKTSQQKRDLEKSLSKFFARTSSCYYLFPENKSLFPLISPKPASYLDPLIPQDQIFEEEQTLAPLNFVRKEKPMEQVLKIDDDEDGDDVLATTQFTTTTSWELIDNPFLKPTVPRMTPKGQKNK